MTDCQNVQRKRLHATKKKCQLFLGAKPVLEVASFHDARAQRVSVVSDSVFHIEQHNDGGKWYAAKEAARIREIKRSRPVAITIEIDESTVPFIWSSGCSHGQAIF